MRRGWLTLGLVAFAAAIVQFTRAERGSGAAWFWYIGIIVIAASLADEMTRRKE